MAPKFHVLSITPNGRSGEVCSLPGLPSQGCSLPPPPGWPLPTRHRRSRAVTGADTAGMRADSSATGDTPKSEQPGRRRPVVDSEMLASGCNPGPEESFLVLGPTRLRGGRADRPPCSRKAQNPTPPMWPHWSPARRRGLRVAVDGAGAVQAGGVRVAATGFPSSPACLGQREAAAAGIRRQWIVYDHRHQAALYLPRLKHEKRRQDSLYCC